MNKKKEEEVQAEIEEVTSGAAAASDISVHVTVTEQ